MKFLKTKFEGLFIIESKSYLDNRGIFRVVFNKLNFKSSLGHDIEFCQDNQVFSSKNVLRGLHFQADQHSQSKLVYVSSGSILDIAVDLRKNSKTYGKYFSYNLSAENSKALFIPPGFAHGYLSLSDKTCVNYKVDNYYNINSERHISFDDKFLKINWGIPKDEIIVSEKDLRSSKFKW